MCYLGPAILSQITSNAGLMFIGGNGLTKVLYIIYFCWSKLSCKTTTSQSVLILLACILIGFESAALVVIARKIPHKMFMNIIYDGMGLTVMCFVLEDLVFRPIIKGSLAWFRQKWTA
jgi:hypothetical protein